MIGERAMTVSIEDAGRILGISRTFTYELARRGELPGLLRLGQRRLRVSRVALDEFLAQPPTHDQ